MQYKVEKNFKVAATKACLGQVKKHLKNTGFLLEKQKLALLPQGDSWINNNVEVLSL